MKPGRIAIFSCAALAVALASDAWAGGNGRGFGRAIRGAAGAPAAGVSTPAPRIHHFHRRPAVFVGGFVYPPFFYYPPPAYYYPPPVYYTPPPTYIEQTPLEPGAQPYWYYCPESGAYYPYVRECPGGWDRVPPQPNDLSPTG